MIDLLSSICCCFLVSFLFAQCVFLIYQFAVLIVFQFDVEDMIAPLSVIAFFLICFRRGLRRTW